MARQDEILIELGSRRKDTGPGTWVPHPWVKCEEFDLYLEGPGTILSQIMLLFPPSCAVDRQVRIVRGGTTCFKLVPLSAWKSYPVVQRLREKRAARNWKKENDES